MFEIISAQPDARAADKGAAGGAPLSRLRPAARAADEGAVGGAPLPRVCGPLPAQAAGPAPAPARRRQPADGGAAQRVHRGARRPLHRALRHAAGPHPARLRRPGSRMSSARLQQVPPFLVARNTQTNTCATKQGTASKGCVPLEEEATYTWEEDLGTVQGGFRCFRRQLVCARSVARGYEKANLKQRRRLPITARAA
eukprot:6523687-Pyramimonas_sp.AAC.1